MQKRLQQFKITLYIFRTFRSIRWKTFSDCFLSINRMHIRWHPQTRYLLLANITLNRRLKWIWTRKNTWQIILGLGNVGEYFDSIYRDFVGFSFNLSGERERGGNYYDLSFFLTLHIVFHFQLQYIIAIKSHYTIFFCYGLSSLEIVSRPIIPKHVYAVNHMNDSNRKGIYIHRNQSIIILCFAEQVNHKIYNWNSPRQISDSGSS